MTIQKISYCNLDKLFNVIKAGQNDGGGKCSLGRNFIDLLNHVQITLKIYDVKVLDLFFLKKYCGGAITLGTLYLTDDSIGEYPKLKELKSTVEKIISVSKEINNDEDLEVVPHELLFPAIALTGDCYVTFTGRSLLNIMDSPELFFRKVFGIANGDIHEDVEYPDSLEEYKSKIDDEVTRAFIEGFYKSEGHVLEGYDLLTDSSMKTGYYDYIEYGSALLEHINTNIGCLNFVGKEAENIASQMAILKLLTVKDENDIYLHLGIKTSLAGFFKLFLDLPMEMFTDNQDFKALLKTEKVIDIKGLEKYHFRLTKRVEELNELKKDVMNQPEYGLTRFHFIPLNSLFCYSIRVSLYDIKTLIKEMKEKYMTTEKRTCVEQELIILFESIERIGSMIENSLYKD